jgi:hypothetical protein
VSAYVGSSKNLKDLKVLRGPNIGKHFALPKMGSAAKPCVLSDCSKKNRGSSRKAMLVLIKVFFSSSPPFLCQGQHALPPQAPTSLPPHLDCS